MSQNLFQNIFMNSPSSIVSLFARLKTGNTIEVGDTTDGGGDTIDGSLNWPYGHPFLDRDFKIYKFCQNTMQTPIKYVFTK